MPHWRVKFTRRGDEPPMPFGKTSVVVCTNTRDHAKSVVPASPRYPITASKTLDAVSFGFYCGCYSDTLVRKGRQ